MVLTPLTRRALLRGGAGAAIVGASGGLAACHRRTGPRLVVVAARGGWDPTFAFDPKHGVPGIDGPAVHASGIGDDVEVLATVGGVPLAGNAAVRPSVTTFFERWGDRSVVVNGISVGSIAHVECVRRMWTGGDDAAAPDLCAILGAAAGSALPIGALDVGTGIIPGTLGAGVARLGWSGQARDLAASRLGDADRAAIARWKARRADRAGLPGLDTSATRRADALGSALAALSLDPDDPVDAAVRALAGNLCAAVYLDPHTDWDTHDDNVHQNENFEALFALLDALAAGLDANGLLDRTLVLVLSEMGRTPWRNAVGGKDHWPVTSALLFGGGLGGGVVLGGTDEALGALPVDVVTGEPWDGGVTLRPAHVLAGVLARLDVDPGAWFPGVVPLGFG